VPDDPLIDVVFRALKDEKFFNALIKDVDAALKAAKISLTASQRARLKRALQAPPTTVRLDLPAFLRAAHGQNISFRWVGFSWVDGDD
jgi:hypothetical protein